MNDPVMRERLGGLLPSRLDILVFLFAFVAGLGAYGLLRVLGFAQAVVTTAVVAIMVLYAIVVARVPRLRVRLDQAGDNAYYLGLLFTLVSMAVALHEFGLTDAAGDGGGARQIIANFGIALATTITGIFLRIILNQMRLDPAEVESMTRIELADAATRVKAALDSVSIRSAQALGEMQQRSADHLRTLVATTNDVLGSFVRTTTERVGSFVAETSQAQQAAVAQVSNLTVQLAAAADETVAAVEKLQLVEPPPLRMANRLERVATALENVSGRLDEFHGHFAIAQGTVERLTEVLAVSARELSRGAALASEWHRAVTDQITTAGDQLAKIVERLGTTIEEERVGLAGLGEQMKLSTAAAREAQDAATEVVEGLTGVLRTMKNLIESPPPTQYTP